MKTFCPECGSAMMYEVYTVSLETSFVNGAKRYRRHFYYKDANELMTSTETSTGAVKCSNCAYRGERLVHIPETFFA